MSAPLDKQRVKIEPGSSTKTSFPALHPRWVEKVQFVSYQAPPSDLTDRGQYEEWCERLRFIEDDLHWLLQLPHDKFWCQAVFDETLHKLIDSYLRYSPRLYDVIYELPEETKDRHDEIHRLVFMACLRMATYKESKDCYITPSVFGEILYENFIFDIPKLLDLCVLYGHGNGQLLSKMIENIFTQQPKYNDDLAQTISTLSQVFDGVVVKCGMKLDSSLSPKKLNMSSSQGPQLITMAEPEFKDVILYLADIGLTLTSFLDVYPPACQVFHDSDFLSRLPVFYDSVVPEVFTALKQREMDQSQKNILKQKLVQAKKCLLSLFQAVISNCCIQPILEKRGVTTDYVEDYLHIMSSLLGERRFLADYESVYSFQGDLDILSQASCSLDETRVQYIQEAVNVAFSTFGRRKEPKGAMKSGGRRSPDGSPNPLDDSGSSCGATAAGGGATASGSASATQSDAFQVEDIDAEGACAPRVTGVELDSLITSVKDLLPDLGEGFIELCLKELSYEIERVINAVLEDRLPPSLQDIDRNLQREKKEAPPPSLVSERKNIYDYDEFDVFHRDDVDKTKIRTGKVSKTDDIQLGDHSAIRDIKSNISKDYGLVCDLVDDDGNEAYTRDVYDDEYDDTYDTNVVGADDADSADELTNIRPFTVPRILGGHIKKERQERSEESEDSEEEPRRRRNNFVEDPAVLRQRAEERARLKASRGKGHHGHGQNQGQPQKTHDVKGGPKGQGQSDDVLRNRKWKTQHKGDHRRNMADKKRRV